MGGSEEWIHPGNRLANITSGALNIVDVTVESESSFHIGMYIMYTRTGAGTREMVRRTTV